MLGDVKIAIRPQAAIPNAVIQKRIDWRRRVTFQLPAMIAAADRNMSVPTTNCQRVLVSIVCPHLTRVALPLRSPMMVRPGATPTLMNEIAKNAFDMKSETIQQTDEITPTTGWMMRVTNM